MSSLDKVFLVLEAVVKRQSEGASFSDVQAATGLPMSTVHRLLKGLLELGYLTYIPENKRYKGSMKMAGLGAEIMANFNLRDHVHPFLVRMNQQTEFASNAAVKDGDRGVYIDKVATKDLGIKLIGEVGKRFMLHCTGMGKVLLAHSAPAEIEEVLSQPLQAFTNNTITDPRALRDELGVIHDRGYAIDKEEVTRGIVCVAAPVRAVTEEVICSLSVAFPSYIAAENGLESIIEMVTQVAAECSGVDASQGQLDESGATDRR